MSYTQSDVADALQYSPIGGATGFVPTRDDTDPIRQRDVDVVVDSEASLYKAVQTADQTVYVDDQSTIFLTEPLTLAQGVTLVSGRGEESQGARLICPEKGRGSAAEDGIIRSRNDDVRISGLRLRGPETTAGFTKWKIDESLAIGLRLFGDARIDNCEIFGFPYACMRLGSRSATPEIEIDHCHIHSAYQIGLGYCIDVVNGFAHVHDNWLDEARHLLNGFGFDSCSYTAENNVFGPKILLHAVDMHCLAENFPTGSRFITDKRTATGDPWYKYRAGGEMIIRYNTFAFWESVEGRKEEGIAIRGEPKKRVLIDRNRFCHPKPPRQNSGNSSPGHAWRQVNVTLKDVNVPTDEYGYTPNWEVGVNQFDAPASPWSASYGATVNLDRPGAGPGLPGSSIDRKQATAIAQALRDVRAPLAELHQTVTPINER